ncbi:MAG: alpha/beta fold hydrolase [Solirubrobacteraceae bacterium]
MASPRAQLTALVRNGLLRPGPDDTYADGDDATWMDVDWRSLQRTMELLGRRVNVLDTGPVEGGGTPLVFIHGWSSNWQSWLLTIPAFLGGHRCIALDLPGFGGSEMPAEPISIQGYAKTVDAMCAALGVERVAVVGNSMGGFVGAELALAFPTRVERLVLVSAAGISITEIPARPVRAAAAMFAMAQPRLARLDRTIAMRPRLRRAAMQGVVRYPERLSPALAYELMLGSGKPGFVPAFDALTSYDFKDRLAEIEIPVLLVWGENDMLVPVIDSSRYQRMIGPNARRVVFSDTGHVPMIERPSRFHELLSEFLAGDPTPESEIEGVSA